MDDYDLMAALRRHDSTSTTAGRLDRRGLYKRAVWAELEDVPDQLLEADHEQIRAHEHEIAEAADVAPKRVILDVQEPPGMTESSTQVEVNGDIRRLDEQSPLVDALRAAQRSQWRLGVYAPESLTDCVGTAAVETLGLDIEGALVSTISGRTATLDEFSA
jgi:hypothetical protein